MEHLVLFSVTLNQAIGVGFLGIPFAFQQSGMVYSLCILMYLCFCSYYVSTLAIEIIFKETEELKEPLNEKSINHFVDFFGPVQSYIFAFLQMLFIFGLLVAFSSVFSASLSANLPLPYLSTCDLYKDAGCVVNYRIFLTIFIFSTYVLAVIGIKEQQTFQVILAMMRFFLVIGLTAIAIYRIASGEDTSEVTVINVEQMELCYTIIIFAVVYQHTLPSISEISYKKIIKVPFRVSITFFLFYGTLGTILSVSFVDVRRMCNLNYNYLDGVMGNIFKSFVLLAPAIDVIATAPLNCVTIADNFKALFKGKFNIPSPVTKGVIMLMVYAYSFFLYNLVTNI